MDLATGTGDFAFLFSKEMHSESTILATDISESMLHIAKRRIPKKTKILLNRSDLHHLPLPNDTIDLCTIAYGIRNIPNLEKGLMEIIRVMKPGGVLLGSRGPGRSVESGATPLSQYSK